jgi:hypothetical protein
MAVMGSGEFFCFDECFEPSSMKPLVVDPLDLLRQPLPLLFLSIVYLV